MTDSEMDDFNFFLRLAKPLVPNLPDAKDRAMAALWLKKLCNVNSHPADMTPFDNIHIEFLKLLLFVMQGNKLTGIFEKPPPSGNLHELVQPGYRKAKDMIPLVKIHKISGEKVSILKGHPRVVTSIGGDTCEYVAVQEIPHFGIHGYYALSTEPMSKWSNPRDSVQADEKKSRHACLKNTCDDLLVINEKDRYDDDHHRDKDEAPRENSDRALLLKKKMTQHEKTRHGRKSLQKIFQSRRSEIAGVETRPCWGRSRYIDRLIDEHPHLVGDLDLSEADALLHLYHDRKMRKTSKSGDYGNESSKVCAISSKRREVEMRLGMPPCASIPDHDEFTTAQETSKVEESRTCFPRNIDSGGTIDSARSAVHRDYDMTTLNFTDDRYESELVETTDYDNWRNYAYESGEYDELKKGHSYSPNPPMGEYHVNDPEAFQEMRSLVADPDRREPPSSGRIKVPRIHQKRANVQLEAWNPQSDSEPDHH